MIDVSVRFCPLVQVSEKRVRLVQRSVNRASTPKQKREATYLPPPPQTPDAVKLESELQSELNNAWGLSGCNDRRSRRRRCRVAAHLAEDCLGYGPRTVARVARVLE